VKSLYFADQYQSAFKVV